MCALYAKSDFTWKVCERPWLSDLDQLAGPGKLSDLPRAIKPPRKAHLLAVCPSLQTNQTSACRGEELHGKRLTTSQVSTI